MPSDDVITSLHPRHGDVTVAVETLSVLTPGGDLVFRLSVSGGLRVLTTMTTASVLSLVAAAAVFVVTAVELFVAAELDNVLELLDTIVVLFSILVVVATVVIFSVDIIGLVVTDTFAISAYVTVKSKHTEKSS